MLAVERLDTVEGNHLEVVIQVRMDRPGDEEQFLVLPFQLRESILAEVARMRLLTVDNQDRVANLGAIREYRHIHERKRGGLVPSPVGVERTLVVAPLRLIVSVVVLDKPRGIVGQGVGETARQSVRTVAVVLRALGIQLLAEFVAGILVHRIEVAVGIHPAHVVHRGSNRRLDARIDSRRIQRHASPAADAEDTDALRIHVLAS